MNIDERLKEYIDANIIPLYDNNYIGDGKDRVNYVISRAITIIEENKLGVDWNILYVAIAYHDIRSNNSEENHELTSASIMYEDEFLKEIFTEEERITIKEAIEDQRAKSEGEPRSIYGKILSSASRNSSVEQCLKRSYYYGKKKNPNASDEELFESAYNALLNKFGENGYARFYFKDSTYEEFLKEIRDLLSDKELFIVTQREYILKLK